MVLITDVLNLDFWMKLPLQVGMGTTPCQPPPTAFCLWTCPDWMSGSPPARERAVARGQELQPHLLQQVLLEGDHSARVMQERNHKESQEIERDSRWQG